jgi:hypothetical protein
MTEKEQLPAYRPEDYGIKPGEAIPGTEHLRTKDYTAPRIKLVQALSPEANLTPNDPDFISAGNIIHGSTKEILGNYQDPVKLIFLKFILNRLMFVKDVGLTHRSFDGKKCFQDMPRTIEQDGDTNVLCSTCKDARWNNYGGKKIPPPCNELYIYPALIYDQENRGPLAFSLFKTLLAYKKTKTGNMINTKVMEAGLPFYAFVWDVKTEMVGDGEFKWYIFNVKQSAVLTPDDPHFLAAKSWYEQLSKVSFVTEEQGVSAGQNTESESSQENDSENDAQPESDDLPF